MANLIDDVVIIDGEFNVDNEFHFNDQESLIDDRAEEENALDAIVADDPSNTYDESNDTVNGGIPIYLQGGRIGKIISGGTVNWLMNDLDINLSLVNDQNKSEQIKYTFKLSNDKELDEWLLSNDVDFLAKCLRKFKFHFVYSNALKGLFFDIVRLFESYVEMILNKMYNGDQQKITSKKQSWIDYDTTNNLESSSIILYQFGKDVELNRFIEMQDSILAIYIKDKDKWSYLGWCPHVPDIRYRALLNFPIEMISELCSLNINFEKLTTEFSNIKKIESPITTGTYAIKKSDIKKKTLQQKSEMLHNRINSLESTLILWETYYSKCATQVMEIAKIWQDNFQNFGKESV